MATETERQRLRLDLGLAADDTTNLPNTLADDIYTEAGESYTDSASLHAYTRVIAISRLMMQAASEVDHTQNESSEKSSQRYAHLAKELEKWQGRLDVAVGATQGSSARFGKPTRRPARVKEYPGSWGW